MAVKTAFSRAELSKAARHLGLSGPVFAEPIRRGTVQTNYKLTGAGGAYVLRIYENKALNSVLYEAELLSHLADRGIPCPKPLACDQTKSLLRGKPHMLCPFMPGQHTQALTAGQQSALIQSAADIARLTRGLRLPHSGARTHHTPDSCFAQAKALVDAQGGAAFFWKLDWYGEALSALALQNLPMGVCHGDLAADNALFDGDALTAVFDFDHAFDAPLCWDALWLADPFLLPWDGWRDWPQEKSPFQFERARAVLRAYQAIRPLERAEFIGLRDVVKLQVLLDCLWFFLRGEEDFYEKRKIEALDAMGRKAFAREMTGCAAP